MPPTLPRLFLRGDSGPGFGSGHASRLFAVGEAWIELGGTATLLSVAPASSLRERSAALGIDVLDLPGGQPAADDVVRTASAAPDFPGSWVAVDGYHLGGDYLRRLQAAGLRVLRIDDSPKVPVACDVLLDPTPGGEAGRPSVPDGALTLLGARWAPLRREFGELGKAPRPTRPRARLLVSFGGWDPADATGLALRALRLLREEFEAVVVVGADNPRAAGYPALGAGLPVRFETSADMPTLMAWADLALLGGGVTALEACAAGLPTLVATVAENQRPATEGLSSQAALIDLGPAQDCRVEALADALAAILAAPLKREALAAHARLAVDGAGAARVAAIMAALSASRLSPTQANLRPATSGDALDIWRIANDPSVRARSFSAADIPLTTHLSWFQRRLSDRDSRYWVVDVGSLVAGQIRYSREGEEAEVHFSVHPAFRGKGVGALMLGASKSRACAELAVRRLVGFVIKDNPASEKAFLTAGWARKADAVRDGKACSVFEVTCSK